MINWQQIETVLLDMDGTLLDLHFDNYFWLHHLPQRYAEGLGMDPDQCRRDLMTRYQHMRGTLDWYCLDYWSESLCLDVVALKEEVAHKIRPRLDAEIFLQRLRSEGKRVLLITNAHPLSLELKMRQIPWAHHFEALVSSHQFRQPKETPGFWQALHQAHPFEPSRTLFIDDTESVLASAGEFGVGHLLCVQQPDLTQPLRDGLSYPAFNSFEELWSKS